MNNQADLLAIISQGTTLQTSGTTGPSKAIYQSPTKLTAANKIAVDCQQLTSSSRVYTVCKTKHAGGLLAQTLPALSIGADVVIEDFNAYRFVKEVGNYTHTHITPSHAKAIMGTKGFRTLDLSNVWVTCGSDPVTWDIIEAFVIRGATFMANWGMTECGPCAINVKFRNMDDVCYYQEWNLKGHSIMGINTYCDTKIVDDQLYVKGDICVHDGWALTGDRVKLNSAGHFYYMGRNNA
jgi:acyl-CoA synthetase (AMP-forming)/AMP-acid ligase II